MDKKKKIFSYSVIIISAVILVCYVLFVDGVSNLVKVFTQPKIFWIFGALICILLYWFFETIVLHSPAKVLNKNQRFANTLKTTMIGQLFNCITPCASGGQPMQAYHMTKCNMPLGLATSALLSRFVVYQIVLTLYSAVVLIFKFRFFTSKVSGFAFLVLIGFIINTAVVVGLVSIGFFPKFTKKLSDFIISLLSKIRIIKDKQKSSDYMDKEIENFHKSFQVIKKNVKSIIVMSVFSALQLTVFFLIPYFVCLAMGVTGLNVFNIIAAGSFVQMISSFVPLPGASGGAEGSFYVFFGIFFQDGSSLPLAILLWRIITFYIPIGAGMIFTAGLYNNKLGADEKAEIANVNINS